MCRWPFILKLITSISIFAPPFGRRNETKEGVFWLYSIPYLLCRLCRSFHLSHHQLVFEVWMGTLFCLYCPTLYCHFGWYGQRRRRLRDASPTDKTTYFQHPSLHRHQLPNCLQPGGGGVLAAHNRSCYRWQRGHNKSITKQLPDLLILLATGLVIYLEPIRKQAIHFNWCVESGGWESQPFQHGQSMQWRWAIDQTD